MIVLKYINLILIIIISSYIGISKSKIFSKRVLELKNIKNSLNIFKSKIQFTYEPIKDIFLEISKIVYQEKENIFKNFCENENLEDITIAWNEAVQNSRGNLCFDDREIIKMLGKMLGKTDKARSNK